MASAAGVGASTVSDRETGPGASPRAALHNSPTFGPKGMVIRPLDHSVARQLCEHKHYLKSYPGGALLSFGAFVGDILLGVAVLGVGPSNVYRLFRGARRQEVICLARLWLDDRLGRNCESRTLAVILRHLRQHQTTVKAVVAYSDPMAGHSGTIYRAAGFLYLGESEAMPLYRLPDGSTHHSRSLSHAFGTHSRAYFEAHGVPVQLVPQAAKLTYLALIDPAWRARLTRRVLPYPKRGDLDAGRSSPFGPASGGPLEPESDG